MSNSLRTVSVACVSVVTIALWALAIRMEWHFGGGSLSASQLRSSVGGGFILSSVGAVVAAACIYLGTRLKSNHLAAVGVVSAIIAGICFIFTAFCSGMGS